MYVRTGDGNNSAQVASTSIPIPCAMRHARSSGAFRAPSLAWGGNAARVDDAHRLASPLDSLPRSLTNPSTFLPRPQLCSAVQHTDTTYYSAAVFWAATPPAALHRVSCAQPRGSTILRISARLFADWFRHALELRYTSHRAYIHVCFFFPNSSRTRLSTVRTPWRTLGARWTQHVATPRSALVPVMHGSFFRIHHLGGPRDVAPRFPRRLPLCSR
jgi:hypothetical protein